MIPAAIALDPIEQLGLHNHSPDLALCIHPIRQSRAVGCIYPNPNPKPIPISISHPHWPLSRTERSPFPPPTHIRPWEYTHARIRVTRPALAHPPPRARMSAAATNVQLDYPVFPTTCLHIPHDHVSGRLILHSDTECTGCKTIRATIRQQGECQESAYASHTPRYEERYRRP